MANKVFSGRDAILRVYDETPNTPLYVVATFTGDFSGPLGRARAEEVPQISQGKADADYHHIVLTDAAIFAPVEISFGGKLHQTDATDDLLIALSNPFDDATWQPGGTSTFVGVTTLGSVANASGTSTTLKPPVDAVTAAALVNIEVLWAGDAGWGLKYAGCFFPPNQIEISKGDEAESTFQATGLCYGAISKITSFTTGTEIS